MISHSTKKITAIAFAALALIASGLYIFSQPQMKSISVENVTKPSQLDFKASNQIQKPAETTPSPPSQASADVATPEDLSEEEQKVFSIFQEVIKTKNDNDARIDRNLKSLSPRLHRELVKTYAGLPPERLNERGFIVFLIARDLKSRQDTEFIKSTFSEPPCLSLADCKKASADEAPHHSSVNETTLIYPQMAGLYQLEQQLKAHPEWLKDAERRAAMSEILRTAESHPVERVHARATQIRTDFGL